MNTKDFEEVVSMCMLLGFARRPMITCLPGDKLSELDYVYVLTDGEQTLSVCANRNSASAFECHIIAPGVANTGFGDKDEAIKEIKKHVDPIRAGRALL